MLSLHIWPDNLLNKKNKPVTVFDEKLNQLIIDMYQSLETFGGMGLSACQVGVDQALFVYKTPEKQGVMINPRLTYTGEIVETQEEGCLSLPGIFVKVSRSTYLHIEYQNEKGEIEKAELGGLLARIVLHEYEHLQGLTIMYYLSKLKRDIAIKKLSKAVKRYEQMEKRNAELGRRIQLGPIS